MAIAAGRIWREWPHRLQPSKLVVETVVAKTTVRSGRVTLATEGEVFEAMELLRRVLKEPGKHPKVMIIYAKDS